MSAPRRVQRSVRVATALAFASAAVSAYWTAGGTLLLDTVGGEIEELARSRSAAALALGTATVALKLLAGALGLQLGRIERLNPFRRRLTFALNGIASAVLCLWGGANVIVGALVLSDLITPTGPVDRHALRWHVFVWDLWFVLWGLALALALTALRQNRRAQRSHASVL